MSARLDELVETMLDGALTSAELAELRTAVSDPEALALVAALLREHQLLRVVCRSEATTGARRVAAVIDQRQLGRAGTHRLDQIRARTQPRGWWRWWTAVAAVLLVGISAWLFRGPATGADDPSRSQLASLGIATTGVSVIRDGKALGVATGMALLPQDRIRVPTIPVDGKAEVLYPDQTRMELLAGTQARLWDEGGAKRMRLDHGEVRCEVTHQSAGKAMKLLTDQAEAEVVGTRFTLCAMPGLTRIDVEEGAVSFRRSDGTESVVRDGGSAVSGSTAPAPMPPPADTAASLATAVLHYNFEDGARPGELVDGEVVPGPERAGNRFCLRGTADPHGSQVFFEQRNITFFTYAAGMRLSFDCWFTAASSKLEVYVWDETKRKSLTLHVPDVEQGLWVRISLPLDEFHVSGDDASHPLVAGDQILNLIIGASGTPDTKAILYIDNLEVIRP